LEKSHTELGPMKADATEHLVQYEPMLVN
jgi:hypothetical protein